MGENDNKIPPSQESEESSNQSDNKSSSDSTPNDDVEAPPSRWLREGFDIERRESEKE